MKQLFQKNKYAPGRIFVYSTSNSIFLGGLKPFAKFLIWRDLPEGQADKGGETPLMGFELATY
ncbi:hypothetical protein COV61_03935 [Candidatus Micrarchaeota archaeon CG11_big_fil_rev_8_21_14_0_20_47_5]|nr:MAG: hypothetical protein AUJ17_04390 [Candidatus Micrarchaeota archaeon CG1_02_47_40]PIN83151.1 MAG: hypothetical protein COV61_03935 [Candidatus Micrarchaeota archaeon CG11_big_fil_rev_8_21_14_0_20_47_5]